MIIEEGLQYHVEMKQWINNEKLINITNQILDVFRTNELTNAQCTEVIDNLKAEFIKQMASSKF
jgi:hypothetical protein